MKSCDTCRYSIPNPQQQGSICTALPCRYAIKEPETHHCGQHKPFPVKVTKPPVTETDEFNLVLDVIEDLNKVCRRKFSISTGKTHELIANLRDDGATLDDFKAVHRVKAAEWLGDDKFEKFLRPSTLYNKNKFHEYLAEAKKHEFEADPRDKTDGQVEV